MYFIDIPSTFLLFSFYSLVLSFFLRLFCFFRRNVPLVSSYVGDTAIAFLRFWHMASIKHCIVTLACPRNFALFRILENVFSNGILVLDLHVLRSLSLSFLERFSITALWQFLDLRIVWKYLVSYSLSAKIHAPCLGKILFPT